MKLTLFQHAWSATDMDPDGASYATGEEAYAAEARAARELLIDFDGDEIAEALRQHVKADEIADDRFAEIADGADRTDDESRWAAEELRTYESAVYPITVEIAAETLLAAAVGGSEGGAGVSAAAYMITGVYLARQSVERWASGDLAATINALEEWADDVQRDFPGLDFDRDPVAISVLEIGPGDRVDLEGAPGCDGESFIGVEFEFAVCIGAERESPDCVRLDFEGFPSVGFDPSVSLPVIKATPKEAALWVEG